MSSVQDSLLTHTGSRSSVDREPTITNVKSTYLQTYFLLSKTSILCMTITFICR